MQWARLCPRCAEERRRGLGAERPLRCPSSPGLTSGRSLCVCETACAQPREKDPGCFLSCSCASRVSVPLLFAGPQSRKALCRPGCRPPPALGMSNPRRSARSPLCVRRRWEGVLDLQLNLPSRCLVSTESVLLLDGRFILL